MADQTRLPHDNSNSSKDSRTMPEHAPTHRTPRWVKMFGIVGGCLILLFVILHITGSSPFGHMSHMQHGVHQP